MMKYTIIIEKVPDNYAVYVPDLPCPARVPGNRGDP